MQTVLDIAVQAGKLALRSMPNKMRILKTGVSDYVTDIDLEVQGFLAEKLLEVIPNSAILGEESLAPSRQDCGFTWVIDPIDGTTNLLHQYPHFSVAIALLERLAPILAAVYNPNTEELFHAENSKGAFLNGKRIAVSANDRLEDCVIGFGFPYDRSKSKRIVNHVYEVFRRTQDLRRSGASSLDLCYVASGRVDGFFEFDLQPWDYTGGSLIVSEAGGRITDWQGRGLLYGQQSNVLATNGIVHEHLIEVLRLEASSGA